MTKEIIIAVTEVREILRYLPKEMTNKIPNKLKEMFNKIADDSCEVNINPNKDLIAQSISEKAIMILIILYLNYWVEENRKKELEIILNENEEKYQNELRKKYDPNKIFDKKEEVINNKINNELIVNEKKKPPHKIFNWIKSVINKLKYFKN